MRTWTGVLGVALLSGCGSFSGDMKMMCEAPKHVDVGALDPAERAHEIAIYISKNTRSREARELFQGLATVEKADRAKLLEDAVRRAGIEPAECEMLRRFE